MIQLHQLEGFYRVARAGGYARAAREFPYPISAPGVHAQVRKLEAGLGVRLFEQVAKDQMLPTRAGAELLAFCAPFFERLGSVADALARGPERPRVRLEAGALEIQEVLPAWMQRVRTRHPQIEVELRETIQPDYARLLRGEVDVIVDHQPRVPKGVATRAVALHRAFLVVPSAHPRVRRGRVTPQDFALEPFVALDADQPQQRLQLTALQALGARPQRITYVPSVTSTLAFVAAGFGYSLVPWPSARGPVVRGVTAIALRGDGTRFPVVASFRVRHKRDAALEALLDLAPST